MSCVQTGMREHNNLYTNKVLYMDVQFDRRFREIPPVDEKRKGKN